MRHIACICKHRLVQLGLHALHHLAAKRPSSCCTAPLVRAQIGQPSVTTVSLMLRKPNPKPHQQYQPMLTHTHTTTPKKRFGVRGVVQKHQNSDLASEGSFKSTQKAIWRQRGRSKAPTQRFGVRGSFKSTNTAIWSERCHSKAQKLRCGVRGVAQKRHHIDLA